MLILEDGRGPLTREMIDNIYGSRHSLVDNNLRNFAEKDYKQACDRFEKGKLITQSDFERYLDRFLDRFSFDCKQKGNNDGNGNGDVYGDGDGDGHG